MRIRIFLLIALLVFVASISVAQISTPPGMITTEEDGDPELRCLTYKFANGNVTDNGDGSCSIADGGAGGINWDAIDDKSALDDDWKFHVRDTVADVDYAINWGDLENIIHTGPWTTDFDAGSNNIIFEGATADANEGTLTSSDVTADRTWTIPDITGTVGIASGAITTGNCAEFLVSSGVTSIVDSGAACLGGTDVTASTNFTDHAVPRGSGGANKVLQDSGVLIDDSDNLTVPGTMSAAQISVTGTGNSAIASTSGNILSVTYASDLIDYLFVHDFGAAGSVELPNSAAPTTNATGEIALDTTITDHQPLWQYFDAAENMTIIAIDTAELPATDNEIVKYDAATDKFVLEADAGGGGGAFSDAGDPVVLNTTTKDVNIGTTHNNTAKLSVDGDADQVQFTVQGNGTQTDSIAIFEASDGTEGATIEAGGLISTLVGLDGIGAVDMDYGSADITDHTFTTDGTGTAEIVLPAGSIDSTEVLDDTLVNADINSAAAIDLSKTALVAGTNITLATNTLNVDDAFLINDGDDTTSGTITAAGYIGNLYDASGAVDLDIGSGDVTDVTVTTDGGVVVIDGTITQDAGTTLFMGGLLDATGAVDMDYGSADITDHTFTTDGTGTAEIVLPAGAIDSTEILDATILVGDMAANSVDSDQYVDASIDLAHMSSASVDSDNIVNDTIANADMADNSIDSDEYVDNSIDDAHLNTTWSIPLYVQSGKIAGSYITLPAAIEGGEPIWMALFDASQTESILWQFRYPDYCGGTPVMNLTYSMASATADKIDLEVDIMAVADAEDPTSASFDTTNEVSGGTTVPGTAGLRDTVSITLSNNDSIAAGEMAIIRVNRDHDDADDTATGDMELLEAELECTR
jgi:hypothetical protein